MVWFKVDDSLALHPKVLAAGNAAIGLWVRAGAWSAQQLTDGFVPAAIVATLGNGAQAQRLVDAGLWTKEAGGYRFHEWSERNPTREETEAKRATDHEAKVRAGRAGGLASGRSRAKQAASSLLQQPASSVLKQNEAPTRPDPTPTTPWAETEQFPPRVTRARSGGGWHAQVVEARRSAGAEDLVGWSSQACTVAVMCAADGHWCTPDVAWQALVELARDPETHHPGRLTHRLQAVLTAATAPQRPVRALPAHCGTCDPTRHVEDAQGRAQRCPRCHPLRRTA